MGKGKGMIRSSFYTNREKWECVGSILWSGKKGEEPWKRDNGISSHVKKGYGRVEDYKEAKHKGGRSCDNIAGPPSFGVAETPRGRLHHWGSGRGPKI